jgi:hypothetical protein
MARRVVSLAFALLLSVTPVASEMCGVFCAEQHSRPANIHQHHHFSGVATQTSQHHYGRAESPVSTTTVHAVADPCPESNSFVVEARDSVRLVAAITVRALSGLSLLTMPASSPNVVDSRHGPPSPARSIVQVRI